MADGLQVLADTFETRFEPFTLDKPRVCTTSMEPSLGERAVMELTG